MDVWAEIYFADIRGTISYGSNRYLLINYCRLQQNVLEKIVTQITLASVERTAATCSDSRADVVGRAPNRNYYRDKNLILLPPITFWFLS